MKTLIHGRTTLFIVASSLLLLTPASATPQKNTDIVKRICRRAGKEQAGDCLRVLYSNPNTTLTKDLKGLATIALQLGKENATRCVESIQALHSEPGLPGPLYPVLISCADLFQMSARNFEAALGDLQVDPLTANYDVMLVYDGPRDCDQLMGDQNVTNAQVRALGENLRFFANIGDVMTAALLL